MWQYFGDNIVLFICIKHKVKGLAKHFACFAKFTANFRRPSVNQNKLM